MKKRNELLVVEESAVIKIQESEIPMLTASNGSENYVYTCYNNCIFVFTLTIVLVNMIIIVVFF